MVYTLIWPQASESCGLYSVVCSSMYRFPKGKIRFLEQGVDLGMVWEEKKNFTAEFCSGNILDEGQEKSTVAHLQCPSDDFL